MKFWIMTVAAVAMIGLSVPVWAAETVFLGDLKPVVETGVSGDVSDISVHNHIYPKFFKWTAYGKGNIEAFAVYNLRGSYSELTGAFGVADDVTSFDEGNSRHYAVMVDGTTVVDGTVNIGDPPVPVKLDLTGAKSLRIVLSENIVFADPELTPAPKPVPGVPLLAYPRNGDTLSDKSIDLRWSAVPGAVSYGVHLLCVHLAPGVHGTPAVYSFNSPTPTKSLDTTALLPGTYSWEVVGFGPKKPLGNFSRAWTFTVDR